MIDSRTIITAPEMARRGKHAMMTSEIFQLYHVREEGGKSRGKRQGKRRGGRDAGGRGERCKVTTV